MVKLSKCRQWSCSADEMSHYCSSLLSQSLISYNWQCSLLRPRPTLLHSDHAVPDMIVLWSSVEQWQWYSVTQCTHEQLSLHCTLCTVLYSMIQTIGQEHVIRICHNMYCRSCMISWDWFIEIFPPLTTDHCVVPESWWCQLWWPHPGSRLITGTVHHQVLQQHSILFRVKYFWSHLSPRG